MGELADNRVKPLACSENIDKVGCLCRINIKNLIKRRLTEIRVYKQHPSAFL